jgi:hypothetical protein
VSCPDWTTLAASRDDGWEAAVEHFDGCTLCRREALAADPLLVFRRLPVAELTPGEEQAEVEAVRQAVAAMRTAERLERRRSFAGWRRWAAAAVLAVAALTVARDRVAGPQRTAEKPPAPRAVAAPAPVLEGVDRPDARVYQWDGKEISVVMVFDESLDV